MNKEIKELVKLAFRAFLQTFASDGGLHFSDEVVFERE